MINTDLENASKIMLGTIKAKAMYIGSTLIWTALNQQPQLPYDAQISYIESDGNQYIDSLITHDSSKGAYIDFEITVNNVTDQCLLGVGSDDFRWGLCWYISNGTHYLQSCGLSSQGISWLNYQLSMARHEVYYNYENDATVMIDGNITRTDLPKGALNTGNIYLFAFNYEGNGGAWRLSKMKLYSCKIVDNGIIIRDFVPVRVGQTGYLYDKISGLLFGNIGTGDFVLGPDKNLSYYISEGLIFHLDGINKGNTTNNIIWEDLINLILFVKNNINANNIEITNNSIKFTRQQSYYLENNDSSKEPSIEDLNNGDYTIECCIYPLTYNSGFIFGGGRALNSKYPLCYIEDGKRITWSLGRAVYILPDNTLSLNNKYTFSISNNSFIINGLDYTSYKANETDYWDYNNNRFIIGAATGGGASQYGFNGYLYSIRIYNRILTKEEQIYNLKIDNNRFELGLSI